MGIISSFFGERPAAPQTGGFTQGAQIPEELAPYYKDILGKAQALYDAQTAEGYQPYQGPTLAQFTPEQEQAFTGIAGLQGTTAPVFEEAMGLTREAAAPITTEQVEEYMNPYQQAVVDIEKREAQKQFESQVVPQLAARAATTGGFGGSRQAILEGMAADTQQRLLGDIQAKGSAQAYQDAINRLQMERQAQGAAAGQLASMAPAQLKTQLGEIGAQQTVGEERQKLTQQALNEAYGQYLKEQEFPYQTMGRYQSVVTGAPIAQTQYIPPAPPPPSMANQLIGGLGTLGATYGAFGGFSPGGLFGMNNPPRTAKTGGGIADIIVRRQTSGQTKPSWLDRLKNIYGKYDRFMTTTVPKFVDPVIEKASKYRILNPDPTKGEYNIGSYLFRPETRLNLGDTGGTKEEILAAEGNLSPIQADAQKIYKVGKEGILDIADIIAKGGDLTQSYFTGKRFTTDDEPGRKLFGIDAPELTISEQFYPATSAESEGKGIAGATREYLKGTGIEGLLNPDKTSNRVSDLEVTISDQIDKKPPTIEDKKAEELKKINEQNLKRTKERKEKLTEKPKDDKPDIYQEARTAEDNYLEALSKRADRLTKRLDDTSEREKQAQFGNLALLFSKLGTKSGPLLGSLIEASGEVLPSALKTRKEFNKERDTLENAVEEVQLGTLKTKADIKKARAKLKSDTAQKAFDNEIDILEANAKVLTANAAAWKAKYPDVGMPGKVTETDRDNAKIQLTSFVSGLGENDLGRLRSVIIANSRIKSPGDADAYIQDAINSKEVQFHIANSLNKAKVIYKSKGQVMTSDDENAVIASALQGIIQSNRALNESLDGSVAWRLLPNFDLF